MNDTTFGQCLFIDLDFADVVMLPAERLELLVPALDTFWAATYYLDEDHPR